MLNIIGIFSGGLDSLLATKILMEQGLTPNLITFVSPFFSPEKALSSASQLGLTPKLVDISQELTEYVKSPKNRVGRNLNPCIDCHSLMFRKAGEILKQSGQEGFIYSGEVLGQRPLSQNKRALKIVASDSGFQDEILRPLSAKLMAPTRAELTGLVDRKRLLAISGRGRKEQIRLANLYSLKYPAPAGGCLLTDNGYSRRLQWLISKDDNELWPTDRLMHILKYGRMFATAEEKNFIMVGRDKESNQQLTKLANKLDVVMHLEQEPGPVAVIPFTGQAPNSDTLSQAQNLVARYAGKNQGETYIINIKTAGNTKLVPGKTPEAPLDFSTLLI